MCSQAVYAVAVTLLLHVTPIASQVAPGVDQSDGDCGGTLDTMSGDLTITSPSYPSRYPPNKLCVWHVTATASKIVVITFPVFNVRCRDFVDVFDGGEGSTKLIESFCRVRDGRGLRTTSNEMTVVFKSNARKNSVGFTATISEVDPYGTCGSPTIARIPAPSRIVGGNTAQQGSWPWQALVIGWGSTPGTGTYYLCGGTLVDSEWVVTAAHCIVDQTRTIEVTLGEHYRYSTDGREVSRFASQTFTHPNYNSDHQSDIGLIKLASPVTFNDYIMPACLPSSSDVLPARTMVSVSGWGITSTGGFTASYLQQMDVPIVSDANCQEIWGSVVDISVDICAGYVRQGGIDSCSGDSGGPLVSRSPTTGAWVLHGSVSRGYPCANPYYITIYARVTGLVDWLTTTMAQNSMTM
ncbi:trypsin-2-like [Branchiostoma floridae]|uniref:Trypsin-2-like n=1 Tax=Branchiostoma floridae TaxID=7739 RepID=A0A9J7M6K3_BRAFL|nr:trypsin-2-like [Branchiostoma floridae]